MLSKVSLFVFIAFAIGTCETPEYSGARVVGGYEYEGKGYQIVEMAYTTRSSGGTAYFLFDPKTEKYWPQDAKAICVDLSLEQCRTEFGKQLRADAKPAREEGGMGY